VLLDLENTAACLPLLERLLTLPPSHAVGRPNAAGVGQPGVTFYPQAHDIEADQLLRQADQPCTKPSRRQRQLPCV